MVPILFPGLPARLRLYLVAALYKHPTPTKMMTIDRMNPWMGFGFPWTSAAHDIQKNHAASARAPRPMTPNTILAHTGVGGV